MGRETSVRMLAVGEGRFASLAHLSVGLMGKVSD